MVRLTPGPVGAGRPDGVGPHKPWIAMLPPTLRKVYWENGKATGDSLPVSPRRSGGGSSGL